MKRRKSAPVSTVVTYRRVSTHEQGAGVDRLADATPEERIAAGLAAQDGKLTAELMVRGWTRVADRHDVASGKSTDGRPDLADALRMVREGEAGTLMVTKLDRLCRSVLDFAMLTADAGRNGWNLVMLDPAVDLSTPSGKFMANIFASVAELEREMIGERTSDALRALQESGVRLGHVPAPDAVLARVLALRGDGLSYRAAAAALNAEGVPPTQGGAQWYPSSVRAVALSQAAGRIPA